ncbi:hypothetical protein L6452_01009 [Arctium lappa]|uniref:Uncharacterized protein n=1 Tax=Arctium lappa TaxID=4217 RepID=A0ACB9FGB1_ARCLA|nr:hypothetical protein L6452_01009 [Arctium lappa]
MKKRESRLKSTQNRPLPTVLLAVSRRSYHRDFLALPNDILKRISAPPEGLTTVFQKGGAWVDVSYGGCLIDLLGDVEEGRCEFVTKSC